MSQIGTKNREAYLRKMALGGYVVKLDLPGLMELVSLLRRSINNLDQLTPPGGMRPGGSTILIWRICTASRLHSAMMPLFRMVK